MRICIDVSPAVHGRAGIGRYAGELARAFAARPAGDEFQVFYNRAGEARVPPALATLPSLRSPLSDRSWRMQVLRSHLLARSMDREFPRADVFHATDHVLPRLRRVRSVFTVHDLAYLRVPDTVPLPARLYLAALMPRFLKRADFILALSEAVRQDVVRTFRLPESRVRLVYPGVDPRFSPQPASERARVRQELALPERFLLYVGTLEPRKNLARLVRAFEQLSMHDRTLRLVIAGRRGLHADELVRETATGGERRVIFTGLVRDSDLPGLYGAAEAFVHPSLYEGFGSSVLEAMACGTPVACSDIPALRELTGEAAVRFPPADVRAMTEAIGRLLKDASLRSNLVSSGLVRARMFSWDRAARETEVAYREAARASLVAQPNYSG